MRELNTNARTSGPPTPRRAHVFSAHHNFNHVLSEGIEIRRSRAVPEPHDYVDGRGVTRRWPGFIQLSPKADAAVAWSVPAGSRRRGAVMIGTRVRFSAEDLGSAAYTMEPGSYGQDPRPGYQEYWYLKTPTGQHCTIRSPGWTIVEHEDKTITVSPSIKISFMNSKNVDQEIWHGFLERGVWRQV